MSTEIIRLEQQAEVSGIDALEILDTYADGGVRTDAVSPSFIATISAGHKVAKAGSDYMIPERSRDGRIYLHGEAPGLEAALAANDYKRLTITLPSNDPAEFFQQRFTRYTASRLELWGDPNGLTVIDKEGNRKTLAPGTPEFKRELDNPNTKVSASLYFALARWTPEGQSQVYFPDGFGLYRLRTTGRNSVRSLVAGFRAISKITQGRFAGVPQDLWIDQIETVDRQGKKQTVPMWQSRLIPPEQIKLTSKSLPAILTQALADGAQLALPAALPETIDVAAQDVEIYVDEEAVTELENGGLCDYDHYIKAWHAAVAGTRFETDDERHNFIATYSAGYYNSLAAYLKAATEPQAMDLINSITTVIESEKPEEPAPPKSFAAPVPAPLDSTAFDSDRESDNPDALLPFDRAGLKSVIGRLRKELTDEQFNAYADGRTLKSMTDEQLADFVVGLETLVNAEAVTK